MDGSAASVMEEHHRHSHHHLHHTQHHHSLSSHQQHQDVANPMAQCGAYAGDNWLGIAMSPYAVAAASYDGGHLGEYTAYGSFMTSSGCLEAMGHMAPPAMQPQHHHQLIQPAPPMGHHPHGAHSHTQGLPLLNTNTAWPSQLTNPTPSTSSAGSFTLALTPVSSGPPATPTLPATTAGVTAAPPPATPAATVKGHRPSQTPDVPKPPEKVPRKTLSAEQKRAMCQYSDDHPGTRQADIGAKFGVERSTVSKVLRHRDQYLKREQDPDFALKRAKGKHPDFDRTLSNYIRRKQQRGFEIRDDEILEQAKLFASASGSQDELLGSLTSNWLHKFKQKHGIGSGRLMRRASETNIPDSASMSTALASIKKNRAKKSSCSSVMSPESPTQPLSPLSGSRSDEDLHKDTLEFEFTYRAQGSQSNASLASDVARAENCGSGENNLTSSFSAETLSPAASFNFSPDSNVGSFSVDGRVVPLKTEDLSPDFHHRGKRSNTFPTIDVSFVNQEQQRNHSLDEGIFAAEPLTPRHFACTSASSSAVQSPTTDTPFNIDSALASPPPPSSLRRVSSSSSMNGRSTGAASTTSTPAESLPASPTYEEARQAASTLLSYMHRMSTNGLIDQSDYLAAMQLTKKLQLYQHQSSRPTIGGLTRIPEGDHEMTISSEGLEVR
ncbi:hypothetical protein CDD81_2429 [Ophiocordyceps australis]|uniref:HTH CENPB-type domain-containing protein n=1 Tax=Ophiocordyceps australis TaxID=1399860 RepID=A0A2C5XXL8_9HYPO|nr:hypothetical protein CDD81_2429 [Ophiocordyceps australis]